MGAQRLVDMGYGGYAGWGDAEAEADFAATGGSGKYTAGSSGDSGGSFPSADEIAAATLKAAEDQIKEEIGWLDQYTSENPYVFDEEFARQSSTQQYEPYYQNLLSEYLAGVELQRDTIQDEKQLLTDLYDLSTNKRTRSYERAIRSAGEGYFGKGMFFSGLRKRDQGQLAAERNFEQQAADVEVGGRQRQLGRDEEALSLDEQTRRREIGEQKSEAIETGVLNREREAETQYYLPMQTAYFRQFPTSTGSALSGYNIPEYLRY